MRLGLLNHSSDRVETGYRDIDLGVNLKIAAGILERRQNLVLPNHLIESYGLCLVKFGMLIGPGPLCLVPTSPVSHVPVHTVIASIMRIVPVTVCSPKPSSLCSTSHAALLHGALLTVQYLSMHRRQQHWGGAQLISTAYKQQACR